MFLRQFLSFLLLAAALLPARAQSGLTARLDALSAAYARLNVNAVVLLANRDGIVYEKAFGYADLDRKLPMTVRTRFKTESVGKMFTATRIMQLVEQGKLKLDEPVARFLPGWKIAGLDTITVHQLLTHTAGLASPWDHPQYDFKKDYTRAEMQRIVEEVPAVGKPGEKYYYSNSGYYLLGEIAAAVSGQPFDADLAQHVFARAGMKATGHLNAGRMPADAAQPYWYYSSTAYKLYDETVGPKAMGAGGWISDARDLYAFARSWQDGKLLGDAARRMQTTANGTTATGKSGRYHTYGMEIFTDTYVPGRQVMGHSGGGAGFSVDMYFEPESGSVVIVLCNIYAMNRGMSTNYLNALLGLPVKPAQHSAVVRAVDHLLDKGAAYLLDDPKRFFAEVDIATFGKPLLANMAESLKGMGRADLAEAVDKVAAGLARPV